MPTSTRETLLSRYNYDPLDRLVNSTPFEQLTQRFYCQTRLATEIEGGVQRTIVQHDDQLLAQQQSEGGKTTATLLATDQQRSVLNALDANLFHSLAYSSYGHHLMGNGLLSLLRFTGERADPVTGHYHLGNGYRQYNPVLMRFNSPDSWSPFGEGGINTYAYCGGDPINRVDPTGHLFDWFFKFLGRKAKTKTAPLPRKLSNDSISADHDFFSAPYFAKNNITNGKIVSKQSDGHTLRATYQNEISIYEIRVTPTQLPIPVNIIVNKPDLVSIIPLSGISGDSAEFINNIANSLRSGRHGHSSLSLWNQHPQGIKNNALLKESAAIERSRLVSKTPSDPDRFLYRS